MSIDLSQFFEVFFEESFEGLDIMEQQLLALTPGDVDSETLNTIFRAAHSIKGGSGTFGFESVAQFTHVLETLLDQIRQGQRELETEHVNLLLQCVDCLREMLKALQQEQQPDTELANQLQAQLEGVLGVNTPEPSTDEPQTTHTEQCTYHIEFKPHLGFFKTGNEPLYMLTDLAQLGSCEIHAHTDSIPPLDKLSGDECFLGWHLYLTTDADKACIEEVFEWVEGDADISISASSGLFEQAPPQVELVETPIESTEELAETPIKSAASPERKATPKTNTVKKAPAQESSSIRVSIDKVDSLINMVGELVITQSMLGQLSEQPVTEQTLEALKEGLAQLSHNTRDLQESVMRIRMLPISFVFSRFPRLVRDICQKLDKQVELELLGEHTELDKTVMEKISDPLVHLVRNSLDHGLESPQEREQAGKEPTGKVTLNAFHQGGNIVIEIIDDGRGLNTQKIKEKAISNGLIEADSQLSEDDIHELIFEPGFSTADAVSDLSGRGVGMDVVRQNISQLGGSIEVFSAAGRGSTFTIRLPLTLAILDGQLVQVAQHTYIVPLISIVESLQIDISQVSKVGKELEVLKLRDEFIPIVRLYQLFNHSNAQTELSNALLVVVESDSQKVGLLVDDLLAQQQVVIKSLEANYKRVEGISGATILGDGRVSLILDMAGLVRMAGLKKPSLQDALGDLQASAEAEEVS